MVQRGQAHRLTHNPAPGPSQPVQQFHIVGPSTFPHTTSHRQQPSSITQPSASGSPSVSPNPLTSAASSHSIRQPTRIRNNLVSPFKDCIGTFGIHKAPTFPRPIDGKVDGYVKFNWPTKNSRRPSASQGQHPRVIELNDDEVNELHEPSTTFDHEIINQELTQSPKYGPVPATSPAYSSGVISLKDIEFSGNSSPETFGIASGTTSPTLASHQSFSPDSMWSGSPGQAYLNSPRIEGALTKKQPMGNPKLVPDSFGMDAKMDSLDRKLWSFYIHNWCPGRSILKDTNLWEKDFALMHKRDGIRSAIQSLAGIYIHDYTPNEALLRRVNDRFAEAESSLTELLNDPTSLRVGRGSEVITLSVILSMQDVSGTKPLKKIEMRLCNNTQQIVLTERRLKKPHMPRWLHGFRQAEYFLDLTDSGSRYWNKDHVQLDSLGLSQAIIVGRAVILAQPMATLPPSSEFDPETDVKRFGWLLYGTKPEMYEIHGGCGFSKKLLHLISQITYCAARLQQEPESMIVPMTAEYLLQELQDMKQWSRASRTWEEAQDGLQTIDEVKMWPEGYILMSIGEMTEVTAEAWRFAAIIYLKCRVLR